MNEYKPEIRITDMEEEMQQEVIKCAVEAITKYDFFNFELIKFDL